MNEQKVKELVLAAGAEYHFSGDIVVNHVETFAKKLIEITVRECIERVSSQYTPVRDSTIEGRPNPFFPELRVRTECEQGIVEYGIKSVMALEELIQEQTDKWYKENVLGDEE